jgi:hypothetical protein
VITIALSSIFAIWRLLYSLFESNFGRHDLKFNYAARAQEYAKGTEVIGQILFTFFDTFMPLCILFLNIRTIDYYDYMLNLMKGIGCMKYFKICSIFIRPKKSRYNDGINEYLSDPFSSKESKPDEYIPINNYILDKTFTNLEITDTVENSSEK